METIKPEIISRETIKPSTPTPDSKRIYKISLLDQLFGSVYVPIIFFYQNKEGNNNSISSGLKKSLSETLTHYYPLAGRIKDGATIECNDEGAYFIEALVESHLQEFLKHHEVRDIYLFMPGEMESETGSLLLIQITLFGCGGIAIGMRMSHMVADVAGMSAFINDWGTMMTRKSCKEISAELTHFFPPSDSLSMPEPGPCKGNLVKRRFVFDSIKLGKLKTKAIQSGVENPTCVEVVTALIYRCAVAAASKLSSVGFLEPSVLIQAVNLRKRIIPPFPEKYFGNMVWSYTIQTHAQESEIEFPALVGQLKAGLADFCRTYGKNFTGQELIQVLFGEKAKTDSNDDHHHVNEYICTSWCRSLLYQSDFGWGKPIWVGHAGIGFKNLICLNDTREGDGIEAFVTLEEQEMAVFERNEELLQFCYLH